MASTTTAINACNTSVWLDNAAGTLTEITGSSNKLDITLDNEVGEFQTFGSACMYRLACGKDATITLTAIYSTTATEAMQLLLAWHFDTNTTARTFTWYEPNKNVGSDKFSGEFLLKSLKWTADRGEPSAILVTAELLPNGCLTHTTAAT